MTSNQRFIVGTLGATLAGAVVGVLLAPKKGTETRRMLKTKANDLSSTAKKTFDENYSKGREALSGVTEKVKSQFDSLNNGNSGMNTSRKSDHSMGANSSADTTPSTASMAHPATGTTSDTLDTPGSMSTSGGANKFNGNS